MKIFVVGGAGYIGSVCSELLLNEGHEVAIFDNLSEAIGAQLIPERISLKANLRIASRSKLPFPVIDRTP